MIIPSKELRNDLDLLSSGQQISQGNPRHSGHLHVVDQRHQLVDQSQRQEGVLQTVDGQPSPRLLIAVLQIRDDGVMDVFFLFLQKVVADSVEGVGPQLVVPQQDLQQIEDDPAFHVAVLVLSSAHLLGLNHGFPDGAGFVRDATKEGEAPAFETACAVDEVGNVKVLDIVSGDDVRIDFADELRPFL